jgi:Co/Zn/Cd efflux system component
MGSGSEKIPSSYGSTTLIRAALIHVLGDFLQSVGVLICSFFFIGKHINIRAALIHVLGDFLQSVGVLISSVLIKIFGESCKEWIIQ